jgi:hypothetical protein
MLPLKPGEASSNWMAAAFGELQPEGVFGVGCPLDMTAKYEIILRDGSRYTSVRIRLTHEGVKMWDLGLFGAALIDAKDVLAWKVQEHLA